ncbi:MAG: tetratricopeptide repeat protein, partial [Magnetococcales bacterium]|nr:tetratricopeptide repeat protein [Magnetococcales bacterium]
NNALRGEPDDAGTLVHLGVALLNQGRIAEAEIHLQRALVIKPAMQDACVNSVSLRDMLRFVNTLQHVTTLLCQDRLEIPLVAVQNYGSSGTLLMHSLLDNHPEILSLPALISRDLYNFHDRYRHTTAKTLLKIFLVEFSVLFNGKIGWGLNQMGPDMNQCVRVPENLFKIAMQVIMKACGENTRRNFIVSIHLAYAVALQRTISRRMLIQFAIHSLPPRFVRYLIEDFSDLKFLYMIRHPMQTIGSACKAIMAGHSIQQPNYPFKEAIAIAFCHHSNIYDYWFTTSRSYGDLPYFDEIMIKPCQLEALHCALEATMREVALWLRITWDDHLLESTFDGLQWWNRPESPRISGTSRTMLSTHSGQFTAFDTFRIHLLMPNRLSTWRYDKPFYTRNPLLQILNLALVLLPFKLDLISARHNFAGMAEYLWPPATSLCVRHLEQFFSPHRWWRQLKKIIVPATDNPFNKATANIVSCALVGIILAACLPYNYTMTRYWLFRAYFDDIRNKDKLVRHPPP